MTGLSDPRVPAREVCVLRYVLDGLAARRPDDVYAVFEDGETWSFAELKARVVAFAAGLAGLGVGQGDTVAMWLPNGRESIVAFFAINYLGAVFVPFNTAYRGRILEHVVENADARVIVVHGGLVERLSEVARARLETMVVLGDGPAVPGLASVPFAQLAAGGGAPPPLARPIEPWDTQSIIYTSGTTGPSKGVLSSYLHLYTNAGPETWTMVTGEDRFLVNMPMFHIGGMGLCSVMLARGGSIAMMENFATDRFWPFARASGATAIFLLGVMATFLLKQPPSAEDRDHKVRMTFMVPLTEEAGDFRARFGIDIYTIFNMTEISSPIVSEANPAKRGTCGRPRPGVEVRLVDENDCEVPVGAIGEMIVRTDRPWGMNHGYNRNPEATAKAWRNGWFHTGDAFRRDADGYFYFVDRVKDAIRRRGENISSFEVESDVMAHPAVREAAAIAVPSELGEDEVMAVVAPVPGAAIAPAELIGFLKERMPHFMVPRYVRVMEALPKTPTAKVLKHQLRQEGITADTWDREAAGIKVKRERLTS
jgi:crotonobetaine/carnitine-CoA ligase